MSKIKIYEAGEQLNRVANALEEIIKMVKEDQERSKKYMEDRNCLLYTSPSPRDGLLSRMPSSA